MALPSYASLRTIVLADKEHEYMTYGGPRGTNICISKYITLSGSINQHPDIYMLLKKVKGGPLLALVC